MSNRETLHTDLEAKEKRLSDSQNAAGIVATDDKLDVENARLQELSTQLVAVQTERQQSQSRQRQARGDSESLPEVLQSPVIANLKASLAVAEAKQRDMATNYGKNYPDYKDVEAGDRRHTRTHLRRSGPKLPPRSAATLRSTCGGRKI